MEAADVGCGMKCSNSYKHCAERCCDVARSWRAIRSPGGETLGLKRRCSVVSPIPVLLKIAAKHANSFGAAQVAPLMFMFYVLLSRTRASFRVLFLQCV